jgi:hypothetical protein
MSLREYEYCALSHVLRRSLKQKQVFGHKPRWAQSRKKPASGMTGRAAKSESPNFRETGFEEISS